MTSAYRPVDTPQPNDWADHISGDLDPRRVTKVEDRLIWLDIMGREHGPFDADNYTFQRSVFTREGVSTAEVTTE
jgi:hypothetical protein